MVTIYDLPSYANTICYANDKGNIDLHGHVSLGKDVAAELAKGMHYIGSQLGLGATMAGVATAVGKGIAKSSMPPLQKAGVIIGGALTAGFGHSIVTTINRHNINSTNSNNSCVDNISWNINKFMDDTSLSSLQTLLSNIEGLNITCLSLIIILCIQIIFKLYLKDSVTLNLSKVLGVKINNKAEYYLNKVIKLNKKMSNIYIWLILLILIALSFSIYASGELFNNIDSYIAEHNTKSK